MKKIIGLFLLFVTIFAFGFNALKVDAASNDVARLVIFSYDGNSAGATGSSTNFSGHSFLMVENISSSSITVGQMTVTSGNVLTVGTWGNKDGHKGIWYNLESYFANNGAYSGRVSIEENLTSSELSTLNEFINDNDKWTLFNNCSKFAREAWNSVSDTQLSSGWPSTPAKLKNSIKKNSYDVNVSIGYNSNVGYYDDGTFVSFNMTTLAYGRSGETTYTLDSDKANQMYNPCSFGE